MTVIKTKLVRIGNSRGLRLSAFVIKELGLEDDVEIEVTDRQLIVRSVASPRAGWEAAFQEMAERGDDQLLEPSVPTSWDETEWEW